VGREAEEALSHSLSHLLANRPQVTVVSRTLVGVAFVAECLEVRDVITATVPSRQNVIDLKRSLLCGDATQVATEASSTQDLVPRRSRDVAECNSAMVVQLAAPPPGVVLNSLVAEPQQLASLIRRQLLHIGDQLVAGTITLHEVMSRKHGARLRFVISM
jgi:hypothetical protein